MAHLFLQITAPRCRCSGPACACSGVLRAVGDPRRAMNTTLFAAIVTAAVDPLLIFGLHLGLTGAAISTVISRLVLLAVAWHGRAAGTGWSRRFGLPGLPPTCGLFWRSPGRRC